MMNLLRKAILILFAVTLVAFVAFSVTDRLTTDRTEPTINVPQEPLKISIKDPKTKMLEGVVATDGKDGDISDQVLVESVSKFIRPGVCMVTYAVSDSDNHVAKATRMVEYTDYTSPEFYMRRVLVYSVEEEMDIHAAVGARDCIDGDISDKVTIVSTDYVANTAGVFTVSLQVSNSMGDTIYLDITVHVEGNETMAPEIALKKSLIYIKKGEKPNFEDYIQEVTIDGVVMKDYGMMISTNFNSEIPGTYNVHYYITTTTGYEGHSILTVVVEE